MWALAARLASDGVYLATTDDGSQTIWPRSIYPSADDALAAWSALCGYGDESDMDSHRDEMGDWKWPRVRIVTAHPTDEDGGYWCWHGPHIASCVECWEVSI